MAWCAELHFYCDKHYEFAKLLLTFNILVPSVRDVLGNVKTVRPVDSWKKDDAEDMENESSGK